MLDYLTRTDGSPLAYLAKAWGTVVAGTIVMILAASLFLHDPPPSEDEAADGAVTFILLVVWPIIATGLVFAAVSVARRFAPTYWHAAAGSALVFALIFGMLGGPIVGVVYAWPFFVYCVTFLAWQLKSTLHAWVMTTALHAAVNLIPVLFL
ncbi:MAG: hypothetical protein KDA53_02190 [Hyphomonas sp.]|nr:hypothetical protein [Hyphomonas sp.]